MGESIIFCSEENYSNMSKIEEETRINILMYVIIIFVKPRFNPGYCLVLPQNCELSIEINAEMCIIEKRKKEQQKKLKLIFSATVKKN